jgi:Cytochrome P460
MPMNLIVSKRQEQPFMFIPSLRIARCRPSYGLVRAFLALGGLALLPLLHGPASAAAAEAPPDSSARERSAQPPSPLPTLMRFPGGFPGSYLLYETVDDADNAVVVKRYANRAAVQAARTGRPLPEGSVIIVATHAAEPDPATNKPRHDPGGRLVAGAVRSYAGMESRAGWGAAVPEALRNGDWQYALFGADRNATAAMNQSPCLACHRPVAHDSYVFTLKTLREAATRATP